MCNSVLQHLGGWASEPHRDHGAAQRPGAGARRRAVTVLGDDAAGEAITWPEAARRADEAAEPVL